MKKWLYSHAEIMERVRASFKYTGTFTFQDIQVICPLLDPRAVGSLIRKGQLIFVAPGVYRLPGSSESWD